MNDEKLLQILAKTWQAYLRQQGHFLYKTYDEQLYKSRNSNRTRYNWLLLISKEPVRHLQHRELDHIRSVMEHTSQKNERCYLVAGFAIEQPRIVVLPVSKAVKTGFIQADVGGIDWDI